MDTKKLAEIDQNLGQPQSQFTPEVIQSKIKPGDLINIGGRRGRALEWKFNGVEGNDIYIEMEDGTASGNNSIDISSITSLEPIETKTVWKIESSSFDPTNTMWAD